ncbi:conserved hypothetical protein [Theileria orientalis strain Shintoku]|uniref:AP2/ERF domain-containing protein n=1 Tax=Theileria orientalis strain Shintoku TaxID=869250 RepID=J7M4N8_THEOR|nr:conserved hypothetical protein [Theileria orientalis strain Shintoku]BAM42355.1 conserved hypothetical protein [Theileria orientalis strain Shintoku]|eukprot:XP_009692656.1 conserved hypothetical protein [Theileria orientalis strain Shintoku]
MEKDGLYLLTIGQILENTRNISNISLYYNRISLINNLRRYENNYCWVHETRSQFKKFTDTVSCACVEPKNELDLTILTKGFKCPQECYVRNLSSELKNTNLIVDFSSSQCISIIYKGRLYLYSNLSTCKMVNNITSEKESSRGIICEDCKIGESALFSKEDIEKALYDIIERGEDQKYGLTLLEHTSLGSALYGLEKVQDSVKSIGILEGLIADEPKQSAIDKINVIDCDILLEDVNPATIRCDSHVSSKPKDCNSCKYISDLNKYLNSPIISYCDHNSPSCEHSNNSCDRSVSSCDHSLSGGCDHIVNASLEPLSGGIGEANVITCDHMAGECYHSVLSCVHRSECERCNESCNKEDHVHKDRKITDHAHNEGCKSDHVHKECKIYENCATCHCAKCLHACTKCEGPGEQIVKLKEGKLSRDYLLECVRYANGLVERAMGELESICSSLINQTNAMCQPPLNISIRFLEHFLCYEYAVEYSSDVNLLSKDSLYELNALDKQNVILHEFIQCNVLTKRVLDHTFDIILARIKTYTTPKTQSIGAMDMAAIEAHTATKSKEHAKGFNGNEEGVHTNGVSSADSGEEMTESNESNTMVTPSSRNERFGDEQINSYDLNDTKLVFPAELNIGSDNTINSIQDIYTGSPGTDQTMSEDSTHESDGKNGESDQDEVAGPEIYPYWWTFYGEDNTLGEGDLNGRYEGIRRFTRSSYVKDEASTPKNKKTGNGANYLLTRCVSSDFSTKSNINVSGLHSSRETLCPSEFNQSQSDSSPKQQLCFCKTCIPFISNITRIFPNATAEGASQERLPRAGVNGSPELTPKTEINGSSLSLNLISRDSREEDLDKEMSIVNGLRRSIRVALDVGSAIRKKMKEEHKPLMDTLNVALLSSFRLGEFLFNNPNMYGTSVYTTGSIELDNRYDFFEKPEGLIEKIRLGDQQAGNRTPELGDGEAKSERAEEEIGNLLCIDVAVDAVDTERSTFESDQYLAYDIVSEEDACSYSSLSSSSPKMFNKRKSPSRARRTYRSLSSFDGLPGRRSFEGLPTSRRSTRELSQTDDMYIYDMNNLSDKGEFDDWYVDSDSSKKSSKYAHKRMPPSRPSVSNLTEIYGSQDMLIPMGPLPIGVYFDASRKLWRCQWRENGKFRTKGFSLGHYNTLADARHACILFRCQVGNMSIQPEWLTPNYIKVSDLLNRRAAQPAAAPKKSSRKKKRQEDLYESYA